MEKALEQFVKSLAKELNETQQKHTLASGAHVNPMIHGPQSLFGVPGIERDVISARVTATGLAGMLPAVGSITEYPLFPFITGRTGATGDQPETECGVPPVAGNLKTCLQTAQFGIYQYKTRELQLNKIGRIVNAGETTDLRFVNDPMAAQLGAIFPSVQGQEALRLGREILARFADVGEAYQQLLSVEVYTGSGASNRFPGLEYLVVPTHYDAKTGKVCTALESDVRDFGDVDISTTAGSAAIVDSLVNIYRNAKHNANTMGFNPVQFAFVMRPQLFTEIADIWPCSYLTSRCLPRNSNVSVNVDTDGQIAMRVAMQEGSYLLIDAQQVPVIQDAWMPETETVVGSGIHSSDIYLLPLTVKGGRPVIFWEYVNYAETLSPALSDGNLTGEFWTDDGKYLWSQEHISWCTIWHSKIEPRLRLETPQLAARLQNVAVTLSKHWRDPEVDSDYYLNGGISGGFTPDSLYSYWSPPE